MMAAASVSEILDSAFTQKASDGGTCIEELQVVPEALEFNQCHTPLCSSRSEWDAANEACQTPLTTPRLQGASAAKVSSQLLCTPKVDCTITDSCYKYDSDLQLQAILQIWEEQRLELHRVADEFQRRISALCQASKQVPSPRSMGTGTGTFDLRDVGKVSSESASSHSSSQQQINESMPEKIIAPRSSVFKPLESLPYHRQRDRTSDFVNSITERVTSSANVSNTVDDLIRKIHTLEVQNKDHQQRFLYRCVSSKPFTAACLLAVVANAVWLGYECDNLSASQSGWMQAVSLSFNSWFLLELAIRITGLRSDFIFGPEWLWNLLDVICVLCSVPDFFSAWMNIAFLRVVRLCKILKGLRLIRVLHFVKSLRIILMTILLTLGSLLWSFVAMLFAAYIFAILMSQAVALQADEGAQFDSQTSDNFGTVWKSILALLSLITSGQDWYHFAQDLRRNGAHIAEYVLMFWIFFATFGLINVVVAVFCAQAVEAGESQRDLRLEKQIEGRSAKISEMMDVFEMIDTNKNGFITWQEFRAFGTSPKGQTILEFNGCQLFALQEQWHVMVGHDGTDGEVDEADFVQGFLRLSKESVNTHLLLISERVKGLHKDLRQSVQILHDLVKERRPESSQISIT